jgi:hypothetical protein
VARRLAGSAAYVDCNERAILPASFETSSDTRVELATIKSASNAIPASMIRLA